MTPTERAYCELCLAVWQQGILLWAEAITQTFAMLQIETPGAQAKQARALFRVVWSFTEPLKKRRTLLP
jgi:uncharacterized protein YecE (DUF72 family)